MLKAGYAGRMLAKLFVLLAWMDLLYHLSTISSLCQWQTRLAYCTFWWRRVWAEGWLNSLQRQAQPETDLVPPFTKIQWMDGFWMLFLPPQGCDPLYMAYKFKPASERQLSEKFLKKKIDIHAFLTVRKRVWKHFTSLRDIKHTWYMKNRSNSNKFLVRKKQSLQSWNFKVFAQQ